MKRRVRIRRKRENRFSMALVIMVILMIMVVVAVGTIQLGEKQAVLDERAEKLTKELQEEEERSLEINELEKYSKTDKYIEEQAQEKLGLVNENQIIFKEE